MRACVHVVVRRGAIWIERLVSSGSNVLLEAGWSVLVLCNFTRRLEETDDGGVFRFWISCFCCCYWTKDVRANDYVFPFFWNRGEEMLAWLGW